VAHFVAKNVDVVLAANPTQGGLVSGGGINIPCNTPLNIAANASDNYVFVNWTEADVEISSEPEFTWLADRDYTLVANFLPLNFEIVVMADPPQYGTATGGGNYDYGTAITVRATEHEDYMFTCWTENGDTVSLSQDYTFTITQARTLVAHFDILTFKVTVSVNDAELGAATGGGKYDIAETVTVRALVEKGYRFLSWTENDTVVSTDWKYEFIVDRNRDLVAHFYALEFDDYAATLWDNTFMLDLKRFDNEHYTLPGCRWFKNGKQEIETHTIDEFSYSAGPKITDLLEKSPSWYMFQVTTQHGVLYSTKKEIEDYYFSHAPAMPDGLYVYPNPVIRGSAFRVEGAEAGSTIMVYNQYGLLVGSARAKEGFTTMRLNLPSGIYLIRADDKEAKVVVVNM
jgi:hypothetical protein